MSDAKENPRPGLAQPETSSEAGADVTLARRRARALTVVAMVVVLATGGSTIWWWMVARWQATTDDAYVGADLARITALTAGTVKVVAVHAGQQLRQGDLLVELDDNDARIALARAEAELAKAVRDVRGLAGSARAAQAGAARGRSDIEAARAQLQAAETKLATTQSELTRQNALAAKGFISPETLVNFRAAVRTARASRGLTGRSHRASGSTPSRRRRRAGR